MQLATAGVETDHAKVPDPRPPKARLPEVVVEVTPLRVTLHEVPAGSPDAVNVTEFPLVTKFAVRVPAPLTVAEVDAVADEPIDMEPVDEAQKEKVYPAAGLAEIVTRVPALYHWDEDGLVVPEPAGATA